MLMHGFSSNGRRGVITARHGSLVRDYSTIPFHGTGRIMSLRHASGIPAPRQQ